MRGVELSRCDGSRGCVMERSKTLSECVLGVVGALEKECVGGGEVSDDNGRVSEDMGSIDGG